VNPSIWIYGGVHHDPGTRQKFLEELAKQQTEPHFIAVEWEKSFFEKFTQWRPCIEKNLGSCWDFLTHEDRQELSLALAWEGDAYAEVFPGTDVLWLEADFQEANAIQRYNRGTATIAESFASGLLERLCKAASPTMEEWIANARPLPDPKTKKDLVDRVWRKVWSEAGEVEGGFDRDARWAAKICERSSGLHDRWIAVVVGWQHADPSGDSERLHGLLLSKGFSVNTVMLGP
jgi:hypothetical protein